jgi:hypothetical protein
MTWVFDQASDEVLIDEAKRQGFKTLVIKKGIVFDLECIFIDNDIQPCDTLMFKGSLWTAKKVRRDTKNFPGVWINLNTMRYLNYSSKIHDLMLNMNYIVLPLYSLKARMPLIHSVCRDSKFFMRPDGGDKKFTGDVFSLNDIDRLSNGFFNSDFPVDLDTLAVLSPPMDIIREWRFFMRKGSGVITSSLYMDEGEIVEKQGSVEPATKLAEKVDKVISEKIKSNDETDGLSPIYTIDICEDVNGDFKVVELNSFSCSGIYACDPTKIIKEASILSMIENGEYQDINS